METKSHLWFSRLIVVISKNLALNSAYLIASIDELAVANNAYKTKNINRSKI